MFAAEIVKASLEEWPALAIVVVSAAMSFVFWVRPFGNAKANRMLSLLLWLFSLSLFRDLLMMQGVFLDYPQWFFFPIWFTWALGPLYFFFVKFTLYPAYEWHLTDLKHAFLPVLQVCLYAILFLIQYRPESWFYTQIYKTLEGGIFVLSFLMYLAMSWRYIKYREAVLRHEQHHAWQLAKVRWLKRVTLIFFFLATLNSFFLILDFSMFKLLGRSLRTWSIYPYLTHYSFALMVLWVFIIARQLLRRTYIRPLMQESKNYTREEVLFQKGCLFDPDFRLALLPGTAKSPKLSIFAERQALEQLRLPLVQQQWKRKEDGAASGHSLRRFVYEAGFYSFKQYKNAVRRAARSEVESGV